MRRYSSFNAPPDYRGFKRTERGPTMLDAFFDIADALREVAQAIREHSHSPPLGSKSESVGG